MSILTKRILFTLGVIFLVAMSLNPSRNIHKQTVSELIKTSIAKSVQGTIVKKSPFDEIGNIFNVAIGTAFVNALVETNIKTTNYILFSTTEVEWDGKTQVIGIGLFGTVVIFDEFRNHVDNFFNVTE